MGGLILGRGVGETGWKKSSGFRFTEAGTSVSM